VQSTSLEHFQAEIFHSLGALRNLNIKIILFLSVRHEHKMEVQVNMAGVRGTGHDEVVIALKHPLP
jgi:hypothetical protein